MSKYLIIFSLAFFSFMCYDQGICRYKIWTYTVYPGSIASYTESCSYTTMKECVDAARNDCIGNPVNCTDTITSYESGSCP